MQTTPRLPCRTRQERKAAMTEVFIGITDCADCGSHVLSTADATVVCDACQAVRAAIALVASTPSRCTGDDTSAADPGL